MLKIEPHTIKLLRSRLERGDLAELSRLTGLSRPTVEEAFKGEAITTSTRTVLEAFSKLIEDRNNGLIEKAVLSTKLLRIAELFGANNIGFTDQKQDDGSIRVAKIYEPMNQQVLNQLKEDGIELTLSVVDKETMDSQGSYEIYLYYLKP